MEYSSLDGLVLLEIDGVQYTNQETWVSFFFLLHIEDVDKICFSFSITYHQTNGEPVLLQSGTFLVGKIPFDQVDDPAAVAVTTGYVGCIERVSGYSMSFYVWDSNQVQVTLISYRCLDNIFKKKGTVRFMT